MALAIGSAASAATNILTDGDFAAPTYLGPSSEFGTGFGGQFVTGWQGGPGLEEWFRAGTQTTISALNHWNDPLDYFSSAVVDAPGGHGFVALDGDPAVQGSISRDLTGLQVGKTYTLTFDWAAAQLLNRVGAYDEQLVVSLGGETHSTLVLSEPSQGFSGWHTVTMFFTPTMADETISFLSVSTTGGLPPMALLSNVSLTVPEPATWAMMIMGFGSLGLMMRRRRMVTAA